MEDIRFSENKVKLSNSIRFSKFLLRIKKNWWKILIVILILFIIIFPNVTGHLLGSWWNSFATSFLQKITF
jgi:hypothetical protein